MDPDPELLEMVQNELDKVDIASETQMATIQELQLCGGGAGDFGPCRNVGFGTAELSQDLAVDGAVVAGAEGLKGPEPITATDLTSTESIKESFPGPNAGAANSHSATVKKEQTATVLIMMGMAGAGKTSWTKTFADHLKSQNKISYNVNLDPGCRNLPYTINIDIRDSINLKELMKKYKLGPNGGMITALNLFALKMNELLSILELRAKEYDYILIDTPGQMECFVWSASGSIITQGLAQRFPTTLVYLMDLPRCRSPLTFTQTMLNGLSILYKNQLPLIVTMNKIDADLSHSARVTDWINDFDAFQEDLSALPDRFAHTFASSLALCLDEFYKVVRLVRVSARDGYGLTDFMSALDNALEEYNRIYLPLIAELYAENEKRNEGRKTTDLANLLKDMKASKSESGKSEDLFSIPASYEAIHGFGPSVSVGDDDDSDDEV